MFPIHYRQTEYQAIFFFTLALSRESQTRPEIPVIRSVSKTKGLIFCINVTKKTALSIPFKTYAFNHVQNSTLHSPQPTQTLSPMTIERRVNTFNKQRRKWKQCKQKEKIPSCEKDRKHSIGFQFFTNAALCRLVDR